jgi:hypothetical protein
VWKTVFGEAAELIDAYGQDTALFQDLHARLEPSTPPTGFPALAGSAATELPFPEH